MSSERWEDASAYDRYMGRWSRPLAREFVRQLEAPPSSKWLEIGCGAPGGLVAASVWDYSEGMEFLRIFWDSAVALDPSAGPLHEGSRFPVCGPDALRAAFQDAGLESIQVASITVPTTFSSFDDFWAPFVGWRGAA